MPNLSKEDLERNQKEREGERKLIKEAYRALKDNIAMQDLQKTLQALLDAHTRIAKDGHGLRNGQEVFLDGEGRLSNIDRAAGIEEVQVYLNRQFSEN